MSPSNPSLHKHAGPRKKAAEIVDLRKVKRRGWKDITKISQMNFRCPPVVSTW
jgi:hypothetical protein